jgi:hypothetical protein
VAGPATRGRPTRPIPFTPSRVEPIAPPPTSPPPAEKRSATAWLARLAVRLLLVAGWLVFASWWAIVLLRESMAALAYAAGVLGAILVVCTVVMLLWTGHNVRIAQRGKRGNSSRFIPMQWERDTLGRPLVLPAGASAAAEVRVVLREGRKVYVIDRSTEEGL